MAIRKINGASTGDIIGSFAKAILYLSLAMAVVGCLLAYIVAGKWLEQFAEKVPLHPLYFIGGAAFVLLLVLVVLVLNCLHIARSNPVDSLKNE
jgi:putative ABC transport system permease protein